MEENKRHKRPTINGLLQDYLAAMQATNYSRKSIKGYRCCLNKFAVFLSDRNLVRIQDITAQDVERYSILLLEEGYNDNSHHHYMRCVRDFFTHLEKSQIVFMNPTADLILHRPQFKILPVPTEQEVKKLLLQPDVSTVLGIRDRAILEVLYSTGMRIEELARLNVNDPNLRHGRLRIFGKGRKERVVPIGRHAQAWLGKYLSDVRPRLHRNPDQLALWLGMRDGARLDIGRIQRHIKKYVRKAGIKKRVSAHALRRACVTHMLQHGAHPIQLQMLLGHSSLGTLSRYLMVTVRDMMKMHKASKVGR